MTIQHMLVGVVPPALIAAALLLAAWRPWKRGTSVQAHWGSALALGLAYAVTEPLVMGAPPTIPPLDTHRWLFFIALAVAVVIAINPFRRGDSWPGYAPHCLVTACFVPLLWTDLSRRGTLPMALLYLLAYTLVAAMIWNEGTRAGRAGTGPRVPLTWLITSLSASLAFLQSSSGSFAQLAGVVAVVMAVCLAISIWRPDLDLVRGVAPVFAVVLTGLVLCLSTTLWSAILVLASAAMPGLANTTILRGKPGWQITLACAAAAAILGVAAIWQSPHGFDFSKI